MRISDWSSDVCSSDLACRDRNRAPFKLGRGGGTQIRRVTGGPARLWRGKGRRHIRRPSQPQGDAARRAALHPLPEIGRGSWWERVCQFVCVSVVAVSVKKNNNELVRDTSPSESYMLKPHFHRHL